MYPGKSEAPDALIEAPQLSCSSFPSYSPNIIELPREMKNDENLPRGRVLDRLDLQRSTRGTPSDVDGAIDAADAALFTPISLLPPEILCHIFIISLPVQTAKSSIIPLIPPPTSSGPWTLDSPWIFGHVCGEWRALALSLPNLWTTITLSSRTSGGRNALLKEQLARSANAPLDVLIRLTGVNRSWQESPETPFNLFLRILISHYGRWRRFQLELDRLFDSFQGLRELGPMPLLEELVFGKGVRLTTYKFLKDAPSLRKVVLSNAEDSSIRDIPLPWVQLTSYKATYADGSIHFRNIAMCASTLVECDIDFGWPHYPELPRHGDILILPRLRRLAITHNLFLDRLEAPALQDLYIWGASDHVLPFLHHSGCILTRLTLVRCDADASDLILLLQNTPSIAGFRLDSIGTSEGMNALASALTLRPKVACLCPNLTSLSLGSLMMDRAAFLDMVESRWNVPDTRSRRLNAVAVYPSSMRFTVKGKRRLQRFAEEGMEVVVIYTRQKGWAAIKSWREW
ncbi:hypothetical protein FB451DRAFT_390396 [Mycena latifolia]|nr:hypothetical protein FB451DRAFT_390396 [Mycena latifolia]